MVKCDCGMLFLPAFFNGKCPKCGKEFEVTEEDKKMKDLSIKACKIINNKFNRRKNGI